MRDVCVGVGGSKAAEKCPVKRPLVPYIRKSGRFLAIFEVLQERKACFGVKKVVAIKMSKNGL